MQNRIFLAGTITFINMSENYSEPEDFLSDESFLSWYFKKGEGNGRDWLLWIQAHPEKAALVEKAIKLLDLTRLAEEDVQPKQTALAEMRLMQSVAKRAIREQAASPAPVLPIYRNRRWIAAACIFLALSIGLVFTYSQKRERTTLRTAYGQLSRQDLPDGTQVILNANSSLGYNSEWRDGSEREVWLTGEAFFQVSKTPAKSRFVVHTDHFDIIVTGTRFNAINRHDRTNVLLEEGHVLLRCYGNKEMELTPGDFAEYRNGSLEKKTARQDSLMAWKDQQLVFDKTTLRDLVMVIHEQYGVRVLLENPSIGDSTVTAIMPNDNLDELLKALAATAQFDVIHQADGTVSIRAHGK
jgi:ferric-dicitrate binding protein FerR (iron transport regulator)